METVRVTAPDLQRRAALEKTRARLVIAAAGFAILFSAVAMKLALATVLDPVQPRPIAQMRKPEPPPPEQAKSAIVPASMDLGLRSQRAMIIDLDAHQAN